MSTLKDQVKSYLDTLGFAFPMQREELVVADKIGFGGIRDTYVIWVVEETDSEEDRGRIQRKVLDEANEMVKQYPDARLWMITWTFGGFSRDFLDQCDVLHVNRRVPIQFFDSPFRYEESSEVHSAIKTLLQFSLASRIKQPFEFVTNGDDSNGEDDLLEHLWQEYRTGAEPGIRIVVGPAGVGKTWLFRSLFAQLYSQFQEQKRRLEVFPRPIPLIPEYVHRAGSLRTRDVLRSFIQSEVASPVGQPTFEWMLLNRYAVWLFDGLDELYAEDKDFFLDLTDLLTREKSQANILVCARESLLASCETFFQFMDDFSDDPHIRVYKLKRWDQESKRQYARLYLDTPEDSNFLSYISSTDSIRELSSLPFYCDMLRQNFEQGKQEDFIDEFDLMEFIVLQMIEREKEKGLIREDDFQRNGLIEWLEAVVSDFYASNLTGVDREVVREYARYILSPHLSDEELEDAITGLVQFPFFSKGSDAGLLTFEHELVAEYLAAKYYAGRLFLDPNRVMTEIGERIDFAHSLIGRFMAHRIMEMEDGVGQLVRLLREKPPTGRHFSTLLQLLLLADISVKALRPLEINLEGQDLSHVAFEQRDLNDVSFRQCNLTGTAFIHCSLKGARFEGARLSQTQFSGLNRENLEGAVFGDLEHFESAIVDSRRFESRKDFANWAIRMTGQIGEIAEPCPAAKQIWEVFRKYIHPTGEAKRDELPHAALIRGKRHENAPSPEECVRVTISSGYLLHTKRYDRVRRAPGDRYSEMVQFVRDWYLSPGIRPMLDALCDIPNCDHAP